MLDKTWSWCYKDKDKFPQTTGQPYYTENSTKNVLPVRLVPNKEYIIWINTESFKNFKDKAGNPAEPYNICWGEAYLLKDLLNKIIKKTEKFIRVKIDKKRLRPVDEPIIQGDNSKLRKLGWVKKIKIDDTIQEVLNYWRLN